MQNSSSTNLTERVPVTRLKPGMPDPSTIKGIMEYMPENYYPDMKNEIIGAIKTERLRVSKWISYIPAHVADLGLKNAKDALDFLAAMVDGGGWPG